MPDDVPMTEAQAIAALAVASLDPAFVDGSPYVALPPGYSLTDLRDRLAEPIRMRAADVLHSPHSFVAHVAAFEPDEPQRANPAPLFADMDSSSIRIAYDDATSNATGWRQWTATLQLRRSLPWAAWLAMHNRPATQDSFVDFLEDRMLDLVEPSTAELMEIVRDLRGTTGARFQYKTDRSTGARTLSWVEETTATATSAARGEIPLPKTFDLMVPIFDGAPAQPIKARLRVKTEAGGLTLTVVLPDPKDVERLAFGAVAADVARQTERPVLFGAPGSVK